jgi:hypothetical protein
MSKTTSPTAKSAVITVGELISELCRCPDHAAVTFRCGSKQQELSFYRLQTQSNGAVEIELNQYPVAPPVVHS